MKDTSFSNALESFDYSFPAELVAKEPVRPRDSAKLLVYDRASDKVSIDTFAKIRDYLPKDCVLVFNQTKVLPAKFTLQKKTGGKVDVLFLSESGVGIEVIASGSFATGDTLRHASGEEFLVKERKNTTALLENKNYEHNFVSFLMTHGTTPLPPYMKDSPLEEEERRSEYQTVFAADNGSVAAPTAGLHFTKELINSLEQAGIQVRYITLHVQLGTFAPLTEEQWQQKRLHKEYYSIDSKTALALENHKKSGLQIVSVGTTTLRALESASEGSMITKPAGYTELFLREGDALHFVDGLITNFHVPRSSLLMLVSVLTGREKLMSLYDQAMEEKFRLFSFGDGMLIL